MLGLLVGRRRRGGLLIGGRCRLAWPKGEQKVGRRVELTYPPTASVELPYTVLVGEVVAIAPASEGVPFTGHWSPTKNPPLLLVHGGSDDLVPFSFSQRFFDNARSPKYLLQVIGGEPLPPPPPQGEYLPPADEESPPVVRPPGYVPAAPLPEVLPDNVIPFRAARGK